MTKLWAAIIATVVLGGYGIEAFGQGGGNGGFNNADNLGHGNEHDFVRLNGMLDLGVGYLLDLHGPANHHGVGDRIEGGASGDDIGDDSGDTLGGNSTAGGWGGEKP